SIEQVANDVAQLDVNREIRKEIPEVILAKGKEYADLLEITRAAVRRNGKVIVSKVQPEQLLNRLCKALKKIKFEIEVGKKSSTILVWDKSHFTTNAASRNSTSQTSNSTSNRNGTGVAPLAGKIGILAAGTSDIGIAEEARLMAKSMGCETIASYDVGIAGIHRLFPALREMISENVGAIVVVAGMEGALASVVTSMVNIPVIGVPTSVGYGFGSDGVAALASMLQSCTPGLSVVNIDNGIGAGATAALISNQLAKITEGERKKKGNKKNKKKRRRKRSTKKDKRLVQQKPGE
ncbi:MAG TPA: nickel pincer cofactor biosynthesis protein LarB, partial [Nitrososphaeraceae archaeon]|nr:nickel pincer cofactor biosynthesis protein LarB [Nitrososphaeraceae archaeon]